MTTTATPLFTMDELLAEATIATLKARQMAEDGMCYAQWCVNDALDWIERALRQPVTATNMATVRKLRRSLRKTQMMLIPAWAR